MSKTFEYATSVLHQSAVMIGQHEATLKYVTDPLEYSKTQMESIRRVMQQYRNQLLAIVRDIGAEND